MCSVSPEASAAAALAAAVVADWPMLTEGMVVDGGGNADMAVSCGVGFGRSCAVQLLLFRCVRQACGKRKTESVCAARACKVWNCGRMVHVTGGLTFGRLCLIRRLLFPGPQPENMNQSKSC